MVTLKQLSKQLNVSISTVSKALSDSDEISKDTIIRVKKLAEELNYRPNRVALSLKQNETKTIGVIIPNILNRFFAMALYGIQNEATKLGYSIITCVTNEQLHKEQESISLLSNGSVDGFILAVSEETLVSNKNKHIQNIIYNDIPMVMFDRNLSNIDCLKVIIDDFKTAFDVTNMLISRGRNRFAFISTIEDLNVGVLRRKGFENAILKAKNLDLESFNLFIEKEEDYQEQIKNLLIKNPNINAIIAADNVTGTIAVNIANSMGYDIPNELSIIGFTDEVVSNLSVPKLSYINQNAETIGQNALRLIVDCLKNKHSKKTISTLKISTEVVHKETT
ncbi:MAG: LacI family transcriptional regulator [Bacteroidetes bacterium]|nr:MAG: LacI family transcriptional regulator [Bacteroidota bacterium]